MVIFRYFFIMLYLFIQYESDVFASGEYSKQDKLDAQLQLCVRMTEGTDCSEWIRKGANPNASYPALFESKKEISYTAIDYLFKGRWSDDWTPKKLMVLLNAGAAIDMSGFGRDKIVAVALDQFFEMNYGRKYHTYSIERVFYTLVSMGADINSFYGYTNTVQAAIKIGSLEIFKAAVYDGGVRKIREKDAPHFMEPGIMSYIFLTMGSYQDPGVGFDMVKVLIESGYSLVSIRERIYVQNELFSKEYINNKNMDVIRDLYTSKYGLKEDRMTAQQIISNKYFIYFKKYVLEWASDGNVEFFPDDGKVGRWGYSDMALYALREGSYDIFYFLLDKFPDICSRLLDSSLMENIENKCKK